MRYVSTRGEAPELGFEDVLLTGLARDGGLYVPASWPELSTRAITALQGQSYEDVAYAVIHPFIGGAIPDSGLRRMIAEAYASFGHPAVAPLKQLDDNQWLLELFHGPTLAFKDVAMQLLARLMDWALARRRHTGHDRRRHQRRYGRGGDRGLQVLPACRRLHDAPAWPRVGRAAPADDDGRIALDPQLAIEGNFDDCQAIVKALFNDLAFRDKVGLAGVNSINWARIMAQTVYYVTAALSLGAPGRAVSFTVPTGNFGDIFAGLVAKRMGVPLDRLVIATNVNDILDRTMKTGRYEMKGVKASTSPSMDIQVSSNFERLLFEVHGRDAHAVRRMMASLAQSGAFSIADREMDQIRHEFSSGATDEAETAETIRKTLAETGELLDPHTAVGYAVARKAAASPSPMVTLATAHPAKFPDAVEKASGLRPGLPPRLGYLMSAKERFTVLPNDVASVRDFILSQQQS